MPNLNTFFEDIQAPNGETTRIPKTNIAEDLDENMLLTIGRLVTEGFTLDENTMADWNDGVERGMELVKLDESTKDTPFPKAANYKSPTLMSAALKWSDRASTELLRGDKLVKPKTIGEDPNDAKIERGERVADFMNHQLNNQMEEWRDEHDKLLYDLPHTGTVFKKVFFDPALERNRANLVVYPNFVVNNNVSSIERLRRFSETFTLSMNEVRERQLQGLWLEVDLTDGEDDQDKNQDFIEQLGWFDMDNDGLEEPYVFVVHQSSNQVLRIIPRYKEEGIIEKNGRIIRVEPIKSLVKYGFLRDPTGGFLDVGYGHLLASMNEGINTSANQLFDAGKFANLQGGFLAKGFRKNKGPLRVSPGQWVDTNISAFELQNSVLPHQYKEPSPTLFSLMQFIIAQSQELSASADLSSALGANAPATTTLALVQEQQLSAGAIILRVYRAMGQEFNLLYSLNKEFGDPNEYQTVLDDQAANFEQDFEQERMDFVPVANPEVSSRIQRIQQATAELANLQAVMVAGGDIRPIVENFYKALGTENVDEIFPELPPMQRLQQLLSESPELVQLISDEEERQNVILQAEIEARERAEIREEAELQLKIEEQDRKERETESNIILNHEKAETEESKNQIDTYTKLVSVENDQRRIAGVES